uniref:Matrin-type domain-containing protein n=1 Tax=Corethron hystrix TaxID=216773 RepID=A0A7S1BIT6_9STRA|mmetsp:Transcript_29864/g.68516  ORF Transcript_29864/g.68516 Transcript_29864/m.68516 type:complete len:209 (+) Transcript_29864:252-878(+)
MDRQNRVGSKFGGGGPASQQESDRSRKDRLRALALEHVDLKLDPYIMRNHLGGYECRLCLTLHPNEGNYLAHTQGRRHKAGLARRAAEDKLKREREGGVMEGPAVAAGKGTPQRTAATVKIGRPAYQVHKSRDAETGQRCLSFHLHYPETDAQPRHRFMSAYEQRVEPPDRNFQYLLVACVPYETVAFKIPNVPVDRSEGRFFFELGR